jgi:2-methylcitrate dehydratase PrpD
MIESITVSRPGLTVLGGPLHPKDLVDMAHSPAYFTAAGAADRGFSWANATPAKIADRVIHSLIDKVRVGPPPNRNVERYRQGATVTIALRDGRSFTSTVYAPKGSGQLGIDWRDIDAKFRALAPLGGLGDDRIGSILDIVHDFRRAAGVAPLIELLRPMS